MCIEDTMVLGTTFLEEENIIIGKNVDVAVD